jgi:hypothetical protein
MIPNSSRFHIDDSRVKEFHKARGLIKSPSHRTCKLLR